MALTAIGTDAQLEGYMSVYGIASWANHDDTDPLTSYDATVLSDCKTYASALLAGRLVKRYEYSLLVTAPMLNEIWCVIVLRTLCFRRGNPPPASLEFRYQEIMQKDGLLDQIATGKLALVDDSGNPVRPKNANAPSHANLQIDRWYPETPIRVVTGSSDTSTSRLPQRRDRFNETIR
jgi:phage gp36-like protein